MLVGYSQQQDQVRTFVTVLYLTNHIIIVNQSGGSVSQLPPATRTGTFITVLYFNQSHFNVHYYA